MLNARRGSTCIQDHGRRECLEKTKALREPSLSLVMETLDSLPFGTLDLDPQPYVVAGPSRRVRCYVRGCAQMLRPPGEGYTGDVCPAHGIRCHHSAQAGPTYAYVDVKRNIVIGADSFVTRIVQNPFKYDKRWLNYEKSEDALTWNVFRTLQECGLLHVVAGWITGLDIQEEPRLYLWGLSISDGKFEPWDLLLAARMRFESNLPVERPPTEPDITLYLPGYYLILIEAKFTSPNPFYIDGPRRDAKSLTKNELLEIYQDADLVTLDVEKARRSERVYYQLWRNVVFAEWMAGYGNAATVAYVANLTRDGQERESCGAFQSLITAECVRHFVHLSWEDIYRRMTEPPALSKMRRYLETKTAGLQPAFSLRARGGGLLPE